MKKVTLLSSIFSIISLVGFAQEKSTENDWENPTVFQINREPARAAFLPYADDISAIADYSRSPWFLSLNGGKISCPIITEVRFPNDQAQERPLVSATPSLHEYNRRLNNKFQIDNKRTFGSHKVSANAIMWRQPDTYRTGYLYKREEWIVRVNYCFKNRYLLEANGSYSGSEKFAPGQRFGFFPSVGLG